MLPSLKPLKVHSWRSIVHSFSPPLSAVNCNGTANLSPSMPELGNILQHWLSEGTKKK